VDLGAVALEPPNRIAKWLGRVDLTEAEKAPELDRSIRLIGRNFDRDMLEHGCRICRVGSCP
jgi:hypothetical protein